MKKGRLVSLLLAAALSAGCLTPLQGIAAEQKANLKADIPKKYDMRDYGLITPVKYQNPWSSCWAFGAICAAESSILSSAGKTYQQTVTADNPLGLDLSEKHLAWFAKTPIAKADDSLNQEGEGLYVLDEDKNKTLEFGLHGFVSSLFASGTGPVEEALFPYQGKNGDTDYTKLSAMSREDLRAYWQKIADELGVDLKKFSKYKEEGQDDLDGFVNLQMIWKKDHDQYSKEDDWTIPSTGKQSDGTVYSNRNIFSGYTLVDANILPEFAIYSTAKDGTKTWKGLNEEGMRAVKQEILNGRGVSTDYCANDKYLNDETYAEYCDENVGINHNVCIVGWDDSYSRGNFRSDRRPPKDGAWLVKNSWGSETENKTSAHGTTIGNMAWGIPNDEGEHTGYFWLSYYDKTLSTPETMVFTKSYQKEGFATLQYDYLPAYPAMYTEKGKNPIKTANKFTLSDMGMRVSSLSAKTSEANMRVKLEVYRLKSKDSVDPTDGTCLYRTSRNFEYAGDHRIELGRDEQFDVQDGETIAVVSTASVIEEDGTKTYAFGTNCGYKKDVALSAGTGFYWKAVVNKGESFVYRNGGWEDWSTAEKKAFDGTEPGKTEKEWEIDNFSLKAFGNPLPGKPKAQTVTVKNKTVTVKGKTNLKTKKLTAASAKASVTSGCKTSGNGKLTYAKKSGNAGIKVTSAGKVYAVKGTKIGTYTVKVTVKAAKTSAYKAASKVMTVKVKVAKK